MRKSFFVLLLIGFVGTTAMAQETLTWNDLADVTFKPKRNKKYGIDFLMPTFGEKIKTYQGKLVTIKGYFLDISGNGKVFLISKNPMASCFFCGASGPETIMEVRFVEKPIYKTDQIITVTGYLNLNADDVDYCNYILKDATGKLIE